ncbi:right-handed parallel beta-helix repeat-containing protein [Streptomyces sp. WM6372]|uniref:right-handed parallel beta-helix repeat-containing protein n=1 Tax=Streptomyces sp. WM6372 TaxID=1415555 RepID=UPI000A7416E1|nr:right-handed parallel beta-helix repeat-containing protein [Streptomyces sp. WM6372]
MFRLGVFAATTAALATVVALPAAEAHAQQFVPCTAAALTSAIATANTVAGPAHLFLAPGCTYTLTAPDNPGNGLPQVSSDITIVGNGSTIRRQSATGFRIFEVTAPNGRLTLNNLTVRGGRSESGGSGGGGISNQGVLTLNSTTVTRNVSAISGPGGGIVSSGTLNLRNSTVSHNISTNDGGGVYSSGTANISNTTITGNTAKDTGGGLDARGGLTLTGSRVTDNAARLDGGGISAFMLTGTVTDTLVQGNDTAEDNEGGGGILNRQSTLTLERTTVFANRAIETGAPGGGIANISGASLILRNSSVTNNYAGGAPGGIYNNASTVSLTATTVADNYPTNCAPGVFAGCAD